MIKSNLALRLDKMRSVTLLIVVSLISVSCKSLPQPSEQDHGTSIPKSPEVHQSFRHILDGYTEELKHLDPFDAPDLGEEAGLDSFGDFPGPEFLSRAKTIKQTA